MRQNLKNRRNPSHQISELTFSENRKILPYFDILAVPFRLSRFACSILAGSVQVWLYHIVPLYLQVLRVFASARSHRCVFRWRTATPRGAAPVPRTFISLRAEQPVRGPARSLDGGETRREDFITTSVLRPPLSRYAFSKKEIRGRLRRRGVT